MSPVISPLSARLRRQMRHMLNLRRKARGRPQSGHRLYLRTANFGLRLAWAILESFAIKKVCSLLAEGHAELPQQRERLLVVLRRGDQAHIEPLHLFDLEIDLREDDLLAHAQGVVAIPVESL